MATASQCPRPAAKQDRYRLVSPHLTGPEVLSPSPVPRRTVSLPYKIWKASHTGSVCARIESLKPLTTEQAQSIVRSKKGSGSAAFGCSASSRGWDSASSLKQWICIELYVILNASLPTLDCLHRFMYVQCIACIAVAGSDRKCRIIANRNFCLCHS